MKKYIYKRIQFGSGEYLKSCLNAVLTYASIPEEVVEMRGTGWSVSKDNPNLSKLFEANPFENVLVSIDYVENKKLVNKHIWLTNNSCCRINEEEVCNIAEMFEILNEEFQALNNHRIYSVTVYRPYEKDE